MSKYRHRRDCSYMAAEEQTFALAIPPGGAINAAATETVYINVPHILSILNRKKYHAVDLSGNVIDYAVSVEVRNMVNATTLVHTATTAYPTYRAVKEWHRIRRGLYRAAGISLRSLGNGSNLRPALDSTQNTMAATIASPATDGQLLPLIDDTAVTAEQAGEWDFTEMIVDSPTVSDTGGTTWVESMNVDRYNLYLCGDHAGEDTTDAYQWTGVGMIQAWLEDRKGGWRVPGAEEVMQPLNPLAFAKSNTDSSAELVGEAVDLAKEGRPYQTDDDDDAEAVMAHRTIQAHIESAFPTQSTQSGSLVAPCGLLKLSITNNDSNAGTPFIGLRMARL